MTEPGSTPTLEEALRSLRRGRFRSDPVTLRDRTRDVGVLITHVNDLRELIKERHSFTREFTTYLNVDVLQKMIAANRCAAFDIVAAIKSSESDREPIELVRRFRTALGESRYSPEEADPIPESWDGALVALEELELELDSDSDRFELVGDVADGAASDLDGMVSWLALGASHIDRLGEFMIREPEFVGKLSRANCYAAEQVIEVVGRSGFDVEEVRAVVSDTRATGHERRESIDDGVRDNLTALHRSIALRNTGTQVSTSRFGGGELPLL